MCIDEYHLGQFAVGHPHLAVFVDLGLAGVGRPSPDGSTLSDQVEALERRAIGAALAAEGGNRSRAAKRLGLSRQGLLNKMGRYGLE